jgi:type VI secretion system protein ImpD
MPLEAVAGEAASVFEPIQPELTHAAVRSVLLGPLPPQDSLAASDSSSTATSRSSAAALPSRLQPFIDEPSSGRALRIWFGSAVRPEREYLLHRLSRDLATIDRLLSEQVNAIVHHPRFQKLEASWRGLRHLVDQAANYPSTSIRVLDLSAAELRQDQEEPDVEQSELFRKVYTEALSTPGGEPFGVLIGDYEVQLNPVSRDDQGQQAHQRLDVRTVASVAQVATAAFCPFIAAASPALFGVDELAQLDRVGDLRRVFDQLSFLQWRKLRDDEHSRFVGLVLPRVLMRLPYQDDATREDGFRFAEDVSGPDRSKYLWGSAGYAFAGVLIRAFGESGWFAHIRGVRRGELGRGLVSGLPADYVDTDRWGVVPKMCTEVTITDELENELSGAGFMALCRCKYLDQAAFYSTPSVQKPVKYDRLSATLNARISSMLQYVLCVSRFAHYLKVIARHKVGQFSSAADCQRYLQRWITQYVSPDDSATEETKARLPLRKAEITVRERPDAPGSYDCVIHLWPHYALDELSGTIRMRTEISPATN